MWAWLACCSRSLSCISPCLMPKRRKRKGSLTTTYCVLLTTKRRETQKNPQKDHCKWSKRCKKIVRRWMTVDCHQQSAASVDRTQCLQIIDDLKLTSVWRSPKWAKAAGIGQNNALYDNIKVLKIVRVRGWMKVLELLSLCSEVYSSV